LNKRVHALSVSSKVTTLSLIFQEQ